MKLDTTKILNTAMNAFVSAVFGGLGSYAVHTIVKNVDKKTAEKDKQTKRKIGFNTENC